MKAIMVSAAFAVALIGSAVHPAPASAKGCIKGAIVGGAAGHFAGHHGMLGAGAGCVIGHHEAANCAQHQPPDANQHGNSGPSDDRGSAPR